MIERLVSHLRGNVVAYVALGVALLGSGGGYALAATNAPRAVKKTANTTYAACVNNKTGAMALLKKTSTRCAKGSHKITWAQRGPAGPMGAIGATGTNGFPGATGPQGPVGPQGPAGASGTSDEVTFTGGPGANIVNVRPATGPITSFTNPGVGVYDVQLRDGSCVDPLVTPIAPGLPAGEAPVAYISGVTGQYTISTGNVSSSGFTPASMPFTMRLDCQGS